MTNASRYTTYNTVNSNINVLVPFDSISHVNQCKENTIEKLGETCWIHFNNGKCIHVTDSYEEVTRDLTEYMDNI